MSIHKLLNIPRFDLVVPSNGKTIKCRPFLTGENALLLSALEDDVPESITNAVKQIINNCVDDWAGMSLEQLAIFDIEYIFLRIRGASKGNQLKITFSPVKSNTECEECKHEKHISIDLTKLEIKKNPKHSNKVKISKDLTVELQYPKYDIVPMLSNLKTEHERLFEMIKTCLVNIYDKNDVYEAKDITDKDMQMFIECLDEEQFDKIIQFFNTMPRVEYTVDLSCKTCGKKDVQTIRGLQSFFD